MLAEKLHVVTMELPEQLRQRLEGLTRSVFTDQNRIRSTIESLLPASAPKDDELVSSLPLQMSLYFNAWFFPVWWICEVVMLQLKYPYLPDHYKFILVTMLILMTLIEGIRLYLGYVGNLQEKVPELAGFWLLSLLLQFPLVLFQLFNEYILIQPLERGVHIVLSVFVLTEALTGLAALREMVRHTESHFHLQQFSAVRDQRTQEE